MAWFEDNLAALGRWLDNCVDVARELIGDRFSPRAGGPTLAERMTAVIEWWGEAPARTKRTIVAAAFGVFLISVAGVSRMLLEKPEPPPLTAAQQEAFVKVNVMMQEQQAKAKQRAGAAKASQTASKPAGR